MKFLASLIYVGAGKKQCAAADSIGTIVSDPCSSEVADT